MASKPAVLPSLHTPRDERRLPGAPMTPGAMTENCDFLGSTLSKLSHDSVRIGRRFDAETGQTSSSIRGKNFCGPWSVPSEFNPSCNAQLDALSFVAFAQPNTMEVEAQADLLAADLKTLAVNNSSGGASSGNVRKYGADEPCTLPEKEPPSIPLALLSVARVIQTWEAQVRKTADLWSGHLDSQVKWSAEGDHRWQNIDRRIDSVETSIAELQKVIKAECGQILEGQAALRRSIVTLDRCVSSKVEKASITELDAALLHREQELAETIRGHITELVSGTSQEAFSGQQSLGQQLNNLGEQMKVLNDNSASWHEALVDLRQRNDAAHTEIERVSQKLNDAHADVAKLEAKGTALDLQLKSAQEEIEKTKYAPAKDVLGKLADIETRGKIGFDMQTGIVVPKSPLEFVPGDPSGEPTANLKDSVAAGSVLDDIADVSGLFRLPLEVSIVVLPGKGKPEFWEQLASSQASLLQGMMQARIADAHIADVSVIVNSALAPKGGAASVTIQLRSPLFKAKVEEESKDVKGPKKKK